MSLLEAYNHLIGEQGVKAEGGCMRGSLELDPALFIDFLQFFIKAETPLVAVEMPTHTFEYQKR